MNFTIQKSGYDTGEVDEYIAKISENYTKLYKGYQNLDNDLAEQTDKNRKLEEKCRSQTTRISEMKEKSVKDEAGYEPDQVGAYIAEICKNYSELFEGYKAVESKLIEITDQNRILEEKCHAQESEISRNKEEGGRNRSDLSATDAPDVERILSSAEMLAGRIVMQARAQAENITAAAQVALRDSLLQIRSMQFLIGRSIAALEEDMGQKNGSR